MRSVDELKKLADGIATSVAARAGSVAVVAVADVDPETGIANHYVSYAGGCLAARGLVERARTIMDRKMAASTRADDLATANAIAAMEPEQRIDAIAEALASARHQGRSEQ